MSDWTITVISDTDSFESLETEWNDLLDRSNSWSVFLTWEWLYSWWLEFRGDRLLNIITVRDSLGRLVGVGPFYIGDSWGRLSARVLSYLGTSPISSEYLDIIVDAEYEEPVSIVILQRLLAGAAPWNCLVLTDMLEESCVRRYLDILDIPRGTAIKQSVSQECPYLRLESARDDVFRKLRSQLRSTIRRKSKKLDQLGADFVWAEDESDLASFTANLFDLHQKCWNARGESGNFPDGPIRSFHLEVTRRLLARGSLKIYALTVDGSTVATLYGFQYKDRFFYFQSGFDPDWSTLSPGTVLMWRCIADSIDRGLVEFDYLRGMEMYKDLWADESRRTHTLVLIPPGNFKINLFASLLELKRKLKSLVKSLILRVKGSDGRS